MHFLWWLDFPPRFPFPRNSWQLRSCVEPIMINFNCSNKHNPPQKREAVGMHGTAASERFGHGGLGPFRRPDWAPLPLGVMGHKELLVSHWFAQGFQAKLRATEIEQFCVQRLVVEGANLLNGCRSFFGSSWKLRPMNWLLSSLFQRQGKTQICSFMTWGHWPLSTFRESRATMFKVLCRYSQLRKTPVDAASCFARQGGKSVVFRPCEQCLWQHVPETKQLPSFSWFFSSWFEGISSTHNPPLELVVLCSTSQRPGRPILVSEQNWQECCVFLPSQKGDHMYVLVWCNEKGKQWLWGKVLIWEHHHM